MTSSFPLLDRPWITVTDLDGNESRVSIRDIYAHADRYLRLSADLGPTNFAVLRLLLAPLYRAWDDRSLRLNENAEEHWAEKWEQGSLLDDDLSEYLDTWAEHFDLLSPTTPFFQVPDLEPINPESGWKKLNILVPDVADSDKPELFTTRHGTVTETPASIANALVYSMAYDVGSAHTGMAGDPRTKRGKGYAGVGWAGRFGGFMIEGADLRETLLLNYVAHRDTAGSDDLPYWELGALDADGLTSEGEGPRSGRTVGPVALLTWPARRLRLRWQDGVATAALCGNGDSLAALPDVYRDTEPMAGWIVSDHYTKATGKVSYGTLKLNPERALWRSIERILPDSISGKEVTVNRQKVTVPKFVLPKNIRWVRGLVDSGILDRDHPLVIRQVGVAYGSQQAKVVTVGEDALRVSSALVGSSQIRTTARRAVSRTEAAAQALDNFEQNVVFAVSGETRPARESLTLSSQLYTDIDQGFRRWLENLDDDSDLEAELNTWSESVLGTVRQLARQYVSAQGPTVWSGRVRTDVKTKKETLVNGPRAVQWLDKKLREALVSPESNGGTE